MGQTSRVEFLDVLRQERDDIAERRRAAGLSAGDAAPTGGGAWQSVGPVTGLALSGGGIRSASLGLGFLQALYKRGVLGQIDYLSTVSGGGYAGSYLSSTITDASRKIDWGPSRPGEKLPADKQRLPFEGEETGKQPGAVREIAGQGKSLGRPVRFLSRQLWGFLTINLFVVSGLVAIASLLAWLFRTLNSQDATLGLTQLGFRTDVSRAFFPALLLLIVFLVVQIGTALLRSLRLRVPEFGTFFYLLLAAATVMGVVSLFATGDVNVRAFEVDHSLSPAVRDRVNSIIGWTGKIAAFVLTASIIPWLRPSLLLRSGTKPKNVVEGWVFNIFSHLLVFGVPVLLFWFFVQEDISQHNANRPERYTFSRGSFPRLSDACRKVFLESSNSGPSGSLHKAMRTPAEADGGDAVDANGDKPLGMQLAMLQEDIDARDRRTHLVQQWFRLGLSQLGVGAEYQDELNDRRRLREWSDRIVGRWSEYVLSNPQFVDDAFPEQPADPQNQGTSGTNDKAGTAVTWRRRPAPKWWLQEADTPAVTDVEGLILHARSLNKHVIVYLSRLNDDASDEPADTVPSDAPKISPPTGGDVESTEAVTEQAQVQSLLVAYRRIESKLLSMEGRMGTLDLSHPGSFPDEYIKLAMRKRTLASLLNEVRRTNWAILEAYYGSATIKPPSTVFAMVVNDADQSWRLRVSGVSALIFVLAGLLVHVNPTTLHSFYRDQLAPMWIVPRDQRHPLRDLDTCGRGGPYHVLGGTINLFGRKRDRELEPTSRFIFTRRFCGGERVGYCPTGQYARGKYDLADAMAVSGGAVSPTQIDNLLVRVILMLFNLRLGQWLPNPSRPPSDVSWPSWLSLFWGFLFWKPEDRAYCFVTDGGHLENTGIAALLQRRCRVIVALDASQDGECQFLDFNKVLQTARSQYGVRITDVVDDQETGRARELDLAPLRSGPVSDAERDKSRSDPAGGKPPAPRGAATRARRHFLIARIEYPDGEQSRTAGMTSPEQRAGYLIYVKPTLTGDEPPAVLGFDAVSAEFPHDSTLDQFFDAARFDAYRALGEHLGEVVATELEGKSPRAGKESTAWLADWWPAAAQGGEAPVPVAPTPPSPAPPTAAPAPSDVNADLETQVERALEGLRAEDEAARQHACVALDYWLSEQIAPAELLVRVIQEIMAAFGSAKDAATREQFCLTLIRLGEKRRTVREFLAKRAEDPQESEAVRFLCREHGRVES